LKNILYLTDFSKPSETALPFAVAIARRYEAHLQALHFLTPDPCVYTEPVYVSVVKEAEEERVKAEMQRLESQLSGLPHETAMEWGAGVWPTVERAIQQRKVDLIVLGTHGRTGTQKLLLGSVTEEIFRRSRVPVLTIGPRVHSSVHNGGRFHRVLFATDFSPESLAAAAQAISLAQENESHLLLLFVMRKPAERNDRDTERFETSVAEAIHRFYEIVPEDARLAYPPEVAVEYGEPAERIVESAKERGADLIVLGVRHALRHMGAATHLERATAHKVVADATCPVLTVRG
jgi:nucleotide-binding universal stress UspA family protein